VTAAHGPDDLLALIRRVFVLSRRLRGASLAGALLTRLYLRRPRPPVVVDVLGFRMLLDPMDSVDRALLLTPWMWDPDEIGFMRRHLSPGGVFVDAGSHVGFYALIAGRCVTPGGRVLAIEADPRTYRTLQQNVAMNRADTVAPIQVALADSRGRLPLSRNPSPNKGGNTLLFEYEGADRVDVDAMPLLDVLQERSIDRLDGIKLDIEGYEFKVMARFFEDADRSLYPSFVITEHVPDLDTLAGGDIVALLTANGYRVHSRHAQNVMLLRDG
jgi:FkbM family methyltransferase